MSGKGWIKLHRKIRDSSIFNDHQLFRLWMICLTEATHKERDQIIGKHTVHLMPGEFVTGRFDITELYNQGLKPKDRVKGEKTVFRWLETLEQGGFLTIKKTNKYSVVSIDNWGIYQEIDQQSDQVNDQQMTNKRPSNDQQMTTNKNVKNIENEKNEQEIATTTLSHEKTVMDAYTKSFGGLVMNGMIQGYVHEIKNRGFDDNFIIELLLETGESSARPNYKLLKTIGDRWMAEGIKSREESRRRKQGGAGHGGSAGIQKHQGNSGPGYGGSDRKITNLDQTSRVRECSDEELAKLI